jgi:PH domain associated with Beige/BEACH
MALLQNRWKTSFEIGGVSVSLSFLLVEERSVLKGHQYGVELTSGYECTALQALYTAACVLVRPRHVTPGTLRVTKTFLYFTGEAPSDDPPGVGSSMDSSGTGNRQTLRGVRTFKRWPVASLEEVHHARFLLQPSAVELFFSDRSSAMLNFESSEVMLPHSDPVQLPIRV